MPRVNFGRIASVSSLEIRIRFAVYHGKYPMPDGLKAVSLYSFEAGFATENGKRIPERASIVKAQKLFHLLVMEAQPRRIGLDPAPVDDKLRDRPFPDVPHNLVAGAGHFVDVDV